MQYFHKYVAFVTLFFFILTTSCIHTDDEDKTPAETQSLDNIRNVGYTYYSESGNRYVKGSGDITALTPIDIELPQNATWLVSASIGQESIWAAVLSDGQVKAFKVNGTSYEDVIITPVQLSTTIPPTLIVEDDGTVKLGNVFDGASSTSATLVVDKTTGQRAYIADNGDVVLRTGTSEQRLAVNALSHARLLMDEKKRILVLSQPSADYGHVAVLGSAYKHAKGITLIETDPEFKVVDTITFAAVDVVEGNSLIWEDVDGDGVREIITTLSNDEAGTQGGRIVVFNEEGGVYGESDAIGLHNRWRHQIAVAPFKSAEETSLVSIYIPHITPNIEYFRLDDESMRRENLDVTGSASSHLFTGPNIDMSLAGDFDGDGKIELMLVDRNDRKAIVAYEYSDSGIDLDWTLNLSDAITSNASAVTL
ncbi:MAG: hypothetical protein OEX19_11225, partial [Gammaproteobacteria bacterium]|nr:hypothetical protein [Gammaproteobacteria bacterium]